MILPSNLNITPGKVWIKENIDQFLPSGGVGPSWPASCPEGFQAGGEALRESLGGRISFVVQGSQYMNTASPWTPRICSLPNFCNIEVTNQK